MTTKKYIITADDVEDNLTSTLQDVPLSANQGRILNAGKVDKNQGAAQAGKVLGIGADGLVYPMNAGAGAHASTHATGGSDPITPASIGACSNTDSRLSDARTPLAHNQAASTITSGTFSADRLPKASTSAFGAVKVGSGLSVSGGVISASGGSYPKMTFTEGTGAGARRMYEWHKFKVPVPHDGTTTSGFVYSFPCPTSGTFSPILDGGGRVMYEAVFVMKNVGNTSTETRSNPTKVDSGYQYSSITLTNCLELWVTARNKSDGWSDWGTVVNSVIPSFS